MDMLMQEYAGMPLLGWAALGAFVLFVGYRIYKSKSRKRGGTGGSGGGSGGNRPTHHK
jgi:hypothetical protein